jgi:hypothetical protein
MLVDHVTPEVKNALRNRMGTLKQMGSVTVNCSIPDAQPVQTGYQWSADVGNQRP